MSAPSSSNAAMNLWQKFSDMQQAIDAAREERSELERELETCHEKREAIREKKQEDAHTRQTATKHAAAFHQQIAELQTEYSQTVQPAYTAELLQKEKVASQLERWKEYKATAFQTALEESRQFRSNCQRLRLSASMLGLSQASMRAAILAHHVATPTASHDKTVLQDDDWLWKRGGKENSVVEKSNNEERNDPDTWNIPENDDEMNDLFAAYKDKKRAYDAANTELASRKRRKQEMIQDDKGRADKIRLLQKQLDRVVKETKDLSSQIKEYQQLTEESNSMAENYEQRMSRHQHNTTRTANAAHSRTVTPASSARPRNSSTVARNPQSSLPRNPYAAAKPRNTTTRTKSSTSRSQHSVPTTFSNVVHRPPRRRRDRQFGSTLEVLGGHDIDEGVEDRAEETRLPEIFQVDDEEDEDDDDLLSFVAFSKNRGA